MLILVYLEQQEGMAAVGQQLARRLFPSGDHRIEIRNARAWRGEIERTMQGAPVDCVLAPGHDEIARAYASAGLTIGFCDPPIPRADRVLIACPGPSLAKWIAGEMPHADAVVAVNRACEAMEHDYRFALDPGAFRMFPLARKPRIAHVCRSHVDASPLVVISRDDLPGEAKRLSLPAAVAFAVDRLFARVVYIIGADMEGAADFTGEIAGGRGDNRWEMERKIFAETVAWAAAKGCDVHRMDYDQTKPTTRAKRRG